MPERIVNFLEIDPEKITFQKTKQNNYGNTQIGILYEGSQLFVKYKGITPFGIKEI